MYYKQISYSYKLKISEYVDAPSIFSKPRSLSIVEILSAIVRSMPNFEAPSIMFADQVMSAKLLASPKSFGHEGGTPMFLLRKRICVDLNFVGKDLCVDIQAETHIR